jgi:hypothetical protein
MKSKTTIPKLGINCRMQVNSNPKSGRKTSIWYFFYWRITFANKQSWKVKHFFPVAYLIGLAIQNDLWFESQWRQLFLCFYVYISWLKTCIEIVYFKGFTLSELRYSITFTFHFVMMEEASKVQITNAPPPHRWHWKTWWKVLFFFGIKIILRWSLSLRRPLALMSTALPCNSIWPWDICNGTRSDQVYL